MLEAFIFWKHKFIGKGYPRTLVLHVQWWFNSLYLVEKLNKNTEQALELRVAEFFLISCAQLSYEHVFIE